MLYTEQRYFVKKSDRILTYIKEYDILAKRKKS